MHEVNDNYYTMLSGYKLKGKTGYTALHFFNILNERREDADKDNLRRFVLGIHHPNEAFDKMYASFYIMRYVCESWCRLEPKKVIECIKYYENLKK